MNYQGLTDVLMVTTLEGTGGNDDPFREVYTFIDKETLEEIATVDPISPHQPGRDIQNAINRT